MKSFETMLSDYARVVVKVGLNLQHGQTLFIRAPIEGVDFVRQVAKFAYEEKAREVYVDWNDDFLTRMKYINSPMEVFENFPKWKADAMESLAKEGAAFLSISSSDPELLKGVDPEKISTGNKAAAMAMKTYMEYAMNDLITWCVISIPTINWASKVFPHNSPEEAYKKLWDSIFKTVRVDKDDPIEAWKNHIKNINNRMEFLNKNKLRKFYYTSSNGTDLTIEFHEDHLWCGGGDYNKDNTFFVPNMPTEEVFTLPLKTGINGIVFNTKPLNYSGNVIDGFNLTFKDGRVVDFHARKGEEILKKLLNTDDGAKYIGEVALVPFSSPISKSNITFLNTLFDENASCHLALGKAYPPCLKGGDKMSEKELEQHGANDSLIHEDFMIGSRDLNIMGTTSDGKSMEIFKDGEWAF